MKFEDNRKENGYDDAETVIISGRQFYGFGDANDTKISVPFKFEAKIKKAEMLNLKIGSSVELQDNFSSLNGKITRINGNKITVEGNEPLSQALARVFR